jgi:iron complex transport system substrate-binding protein
MLDNMRISRRRLLTAMALSPLLLKMNTARAAAVDPHILWRWSGCRSS